MTIDEFEKQIMTALLAGDDPLLARLRAQYEVATVKDRERTTTGFVTKFEVAAGAEPIDRKLLHLDDLQVQLTGAKTPVDTSLHIHNGRLRSLECFVYDGHFPEAPVIEAAWYYGTERFDAIGEELFEERDLEELLEED
ncbi:MAG TPA: hypothetical protein VGF48_01320 [Thermoanaerobaculia bacterium]|jgi:hypothetical protein